MFEAEIEFGSSGSKTRARCTLAVEARSRVAWREGDDEERREEREMEDVGEA